MALITRFTRLFQADLHAVLDRVEEPDVLLKQAVREMQEDVARDEQRLHGLNHGRRHLLDRQTDLEQSLSQFEEELDVCFTSGNDDLARTLIKRKLETQHTLKNLSHKRRSLETSLDELQARLVENRGRLDAMRQKADLLLENDMGRQRERCWTVPTAVIRNEDVEVAFLREKQQRNLP